jgi:hypothetical protein
MHHNPQVENAIMGHWQMWMLRVVRYVVSSCLFGYEELLILVFPFLGMLDGTCTMSGKFFQQNEAFF